jgi:hypothetical protein
VLVAVDEVELVQSEWETWPGLGLDPSLKVNGLNLHEVIATHRSLSNQLMKNPQ